MTLATRALIALLIVLGTALAEQQGAAEATAWQYARLSTATVGGALRSTWSGPDGPVFADGGVLLLAETLMGRLLNDTEDALIALLNHLGAQGWELVAVTDDGERRDLFFRRRAP